MLISKQLSQSDDEDDKEDKDAFVDNNNTGNSRANKLKMKKHTQMLWEHYIKDQKLPKD